MRNLVRLDCISVSEEEAVASLIETIFYDNNCEFINLKSIKYTVSLLDSIFDIRNSIAITKDNREVKLQVRLKDKSVECNLNEENIATISFNDIAKKILDYKKSLTEQLDLFALLG